MLNFHGKKIGYVQLTSFTAGSGAEVRAAGPEGPAPGRAGADPRSARERRRTARGGGQRRERLHPRRHDRLHQGPRRAAPGLPGQERCDRAQDPDGGACRPRNRIGGGDRHRRASGPGPREGGRDAHLRQGRLPGDPAAAERRSARLHRRRVLHAQRPQPRRRRRPPRRRDHARTSTRTRARARRSTPRCGSQSGRSPPRISEPVQSATRARRRGSPSCGARASSWSPSRSSSRAPRSSSAATARPTSAIS